MIGMIGWLAAVQLLLVGGVLLWAGGLKVLGGSAAAIARRSALSRLVGRERAAATYRAVGGVELAVAAMLLLPPTAAADAFVAAGFGVGLLGYLVYGRLVAPDAPCGCLSDKLAPVSWRSFVRAAVLVAASALAVPATRSWLEAIAERPLAAGAVLLGEAALVVALSPELDRWWLLPLRRLRVRLSHPLAGHAFEVPLESTVQQLHRSRAYLAVAERLRSDVRDWWDEGDWRILNYTAAYDGSAATAVFAVPRLRYEPEAVRLVLVDEATASVLWQYAPAPAAV